MIRAFSTNKILLFIIFAPISYFIAAIFIPGTILRDVFNSLSFGTAVMIWFTWLYAFIEAVRSEGKAGKWRLILGLCLTMQTVMISRVYSGLFNWYDRPESWALGPFPGFLSFSYFLGGALILSAATEADETPLTNLLPLLIGVGIGGIVAGVIIGMGLSTAL